MHLQTNLEETMQPKTPLQEAVQQGVGHQSAQLVILSPWEQDSIASINLSKMRHHANTSPESLYFELYPTL
ncbi:Uncharacterized protein DAT39_015094, partial [Clarias magur]